MICRAGVIRPQTEINVCTMCSTETAGHLFCRAGEMMSSAILSVEDFPGVQLWTDGDMIVNVCTMCSTETAGHLFCRAGEMMSSAILSVEDCPGVQLWTDGDMIVIILRGWVDRVTPTRTTLTCDQPIFQRTTEAILKGEKCVSYFFLFY